MEKVKFEYCFGDNYTIEAENMIADDGEGLRDFSGEYVKAEIAEELLVALQGFVDWNEKYPSSRIYSESEIRKIAKELDAINEKAIAAIAKVKPEKNFFTASKPDAIRSEATNEQVML